MATVTAGFGETAHVRCSVVKLVIMGQIVTFVRFIVFVIVVYTSKNGTDLMQVVNFTLLYLMQVANKLYQAC